MSIPLTINFQQNFAAFWLKTKKYWEVLTDPSHYISPHRVETITFEKIHRKFYFKNKSVYKPCENNISLDLKFIKSISRSNYKKKFGLIKEQLDRGNFYQLNFTSPFYYNLKKNIPTTKLLLKFLDNDKLLSNFSHVLYLQKEKKLYLCNSPECLLEKSGKWIKSFPIKGTVATNKIHQLNSNKNYAELNMIIDLTRNDLAQLAQASPVVLLPHKLLKVPQIVHLMGEVKVQCEKDIHFSEWVRGISPGGSVTGAPKSSVLPFIKKIEGYTRGLYCGSTIYKEKASLNIRLIEYDMMSSQLIIYSGGGITAKSVWEDEYDEMYLKHQSVLSLLI